MSAPLRPDPALGFCRFRIPSEGRRAIWEVTNACNYGCRYCIFASTSRVPPGELDPERALAVVDDLARHGFGHVKFTGGEPFLRPDMADILERARSHGIACDVSTNASRIDAALAHRLAGLGLDMVHVSLDGPDAASHEAVRGKATFAPSVDGLRLLVGAGVPVRVGCVIHARNEDLVPELAALCGGMGAGSLVLSRMEPVGRMRGRPALVSTLTDAEIRERVGRAQALHGHRIAITHNLDAAPAAGQARSCGTCPGGDRFVSIDHLGRVSPCTWVTEHRPDLVPGGTLAASGLGEILASPAIRSFRASAEAFARVASACPMSVREAFAGAEAATPPPPGRFGTDAPVYAFATENLAYVPGIVRPGDTVLTVAGSGDHVIAAAAAGAISVTALDVNRRARLWGLVKLAALAALERGEFLGFLTPGPEALAPTVAARLDLLPDARAFLLALSAQGPEALSGPVFVAGRSGRRAALRNAPYLQDDAAYAAAREGVANARIDWVTADAASEAARDGAPVDAVLLSNLAEHSHRMFPGGRHVEAFRDGVALPLARRLRPGGRLALYAFDAADRRGSSARNPFGSPATRLSAYVGFPGLVALERSLPSALDDAAPDDIDATLILIRTGHA